MFIVFTVYIYAGVPQGSVLGPLLFIIYINDIADRLISLCRLFADDTSFGYSCQDTVQLKTVINHDLEELSEWSNKWLMSFNPEKTEIMIFSNVNIGESLDFVFNGKSIPTVSKHKHLGVTFNNDAKWNTHIDSILASVSQHLSVLRKLKYRLCRKNLEKMYLVYIRPLFEYASEVWDNCGVGYIHKLEQLQLEAARLVTGLPIFTKTEALYRETGWESLYTRRQRRKLLTFYNTVDGNAPEYLCKLVPPTIQSTTVYPLRNGSDLIVPFCRLSLTRESYIPSTIRKWNSLDQSIRNADSVSSFKTELKKLDHLNAKPVPTHYFYGPRKLNIILTQLRCSASFLNYDLTRVNILSDPSCRCGAAIEDKKHYLLECSLYMNDRTTLFDKLRWLPNEIIINVELLTCGSTELTYEQNVKVFKCVCEYIKKSDRFLIV